VPEDTADRQMSINHQPDDVSEGTIVIEPPPTATLGYDASSFQ
jgi:hypothetical protein